MANFVINFSNPYRTKNGHEYVNTSDGKTFILLSFFKSSEFDKAFINYIFKNYTKQLEDFIIKNEGFSLGFATINKFISEIGDPNFFKEIANNVDGSVIFIESSDIDRNSNILSVQKYSNFLFSRN